MESKHMLVMSLYQAAKPSSSTQYVKPYLSSSVASAGVYDGVQHNPSKDKNSYSYSGIGYNSYGYDERIDEKAANYISSVRERFRIHD